MASYQCGNARQCNGLLAQEGAGPELAAFQRGWASQQGHAREGCATGHVQAPGYVPKHVVW